MNTRVLVVDDEPSVLRLIRAVLARRGYAVDTAMTVEAALDALGGRPPALLIVDVTLPDGNGFDVAEAATGSHPELPVLVITGMVPHDPRASRWPVLLKPFSVAYFGEVVTGLLKS